GDIFVTATGCREILTAGDFAKLKDGAILANSGHFDVELDVASLERAAKAKTEIRPNLTEYTLASGKQLYLLAQGRLVGQSAAEGSSGGIIDLAFSFMAVAVAMGAPEVGTLPQNQVVLPPAEFTDRVASMKLAALGLAHDRLTPSQ